MFEQSLADRSAFDIVDIVRTKEFVFVRRGGYDQDQVRQFLVETARAVERLEEKRLQVQRERDALKGEVEVLRAELDHLRKGVPGDGDPFEQTGIRVAEILRSVNADVEAMRREAEEARERAIDQAHNEARTQAHALLREAMEELASGGDELLHEMEAAHQRVSGVLDHLRTSMEEKAATIEPAHAASTDVGAPVEGVPVEDVPVEDVPVEDVPVEAAPSGLDEPEYDEPVPAGPEYTGVDVDEPAHNGQVHDEAVDPVAAHAEPVLADHDDHETTPATPEYAEPVPAGHVHDEAVEPETVYGEPLDNGHAYDEQADPEPVTGEPALPGHGYSYGSAPAEHGYGDRVPAEAGYEAPAQTEQAAEAAEQDEDGREPILSFVFGAGPEATAPPTPSAEPTPDES